MSILLRLATRGLGGSASSLLLQGFAPAVQEVIRIARGGRSAASRAVKDLTETFKISAMLVQANGKEFVDPIFNVVKKTFSESALKVKLIPKKLFIRKSEDIKVIVENVKVRKQDGGN